MNIPVLIAGHSQAKYFHTKLSLQNVDVISHSGYRIEEMWDEIESEVPYYKVIVLHLGENNLATDTRNDILNKYQRLVENIWDVNPSAHIVISGMIPRAENDFLGARRKPEFLKYVNDLAYNINISIRDKIAPFYDKLHYVGHPDFVKYHEIQRHLLSTNGLQPSHTGTTFIVEDIELCVQDMSIHMVNGSSVKVCSTVKTYNQVKVTESVKVVDSVCQEAYNSVKLADSETESTSVINSVSMSSTKNDIKSVPSVKSDSVNKSAKNDIKSVKSDSDGKRVKKKPKRDMSVKSEKESRDDISSAKVTNSVSKTINVQRGGGETEPILSGVQKPLSKTQILELLNKNDHPNVCTVPPVKPKGGEIYLYKIQDPYKFDDWKCDQYVWVNDSLYPRKITETTAFVKQYFKIRVPGFETKCGRKRPNFSLKFKKIAFWLPKDPTLVLIHYEGDESIYVPISHGNNKHGNEYKRTLPSVFEAIKNENGTAGKVYKTLICENPVEGKLQGVANPRNLDQVKNLKKKVKEKEKLSKDDIYNLNQLAYNLDGFISQVIVFPDLLAIVGLPEIIDQFNQLIDLKSDDDPL